MIRIDRSTEPIPKILQRGDGKSADKEFERALSYFADYGSMRQRGGFDFKLYRHASVKEALKRLFHGKCAYCETPLTASPGDIEMYRPKGGVIAADGQHLPLHYWWLANEWTNLYLACVDCNRVWSRKVGDGTVRSGKGGRFPLADEALRAPALTPPEELYRERPLLLDPCVDDVENILLFSQDGIVSSRDERGLTTIEILGLNRSSLVTARHQTAQYVQTLLGTLSMSQDSADAPRIDSTIRLQLKEMTAPQAAYASMCRQLVNAALASQAARTTDPSIVAELSTPESPIFSRLDERQAKAALNQFQVAQESYSLEAAEKETLSAYVSARDRRVERIAVYNLRAISRLDFTLKDNGGRAPWLMLLGENATGKSTILHAIALALIGDKYRESLVSKLGLDLAKLVRSGVPYGEVHVSLSGATAPRILRIHSDGRIEATGLDAQLMLLAYGSTRLLPRHVTHPPYGESYARIDNLFDPFIPLVDAQQWLLDSSEEQFDYAAIAIKKALNIALDRELIRRDGDVGLIERGILTPLNRLCDGYQTVIALIADILAVVLPVWKTPDLAQGLVLIDEVGNHLHPSWKLRFVENMRDIMPGIQVIATTHEPLCLRGLQEGEVIVLRRGPRGGINMIEDLPSIEGLRVDQILTSEHFGLQSTLDPALQALFDRYNQLLRKEKLNEVQNAELARLRSEINGVQRIGNSERERRMLEAIDKFLALRFTAENRADITERELVLDAELQTIWEEAAEIDRAAL